MSFDYSNPLLLKLRRAGQQLGVLRPMVRLYRRALGVSYEEKFDREILKCIHAGDVVWDIGANVGFFTRKFAERTGATGKVLAFEPSPTTFDVLRTRCADLAQVEPVGIALGDQDGAVQFLESGTAADPTNGLYKPGAAGTAVTVAMRSGDSFRAERGAAVPTCLKIDVEGFELEVLRGLSATLRLPAVRHVFVEVHFQILASRGLAAAPAAICQLLDERGFRVRWVDPSHFIASRPA